MQFCVEVAGQRGIGPSGSIGVSAGSSRPRRKLPKKMTVERLPDVRYDGSVRVIDVSGYGVDVPRENYYAKHVFVKAF